MSNSSPAAIDYETAHLSRIATAVRITEKITVDGRLEEPAWKLAVPVTDFTQQRPRPGEPATERTEARFLYDEENLYVGAICFESNMGRIVVNDVREDYPWNESDGVNVSIDSLHDHRSGFSFDVNPAGGKRDGQLANDSQFLSDWDGVWDAKVSKIDQAWIVEFVIPFKTLRFSEASSEWGLQVSRRLLSRNEDDYWSPIPIRYSGARMSMAGTLKGIEGIRQGRNLKIKPFATAAITEVQGAPTSPTPTFNFSASWNSILSSCEAIHRAGPETTRHAASRRAGRMMNCW